MNGETNEADGSSGQTQTTTNVSYSRGSSRPPPVLDNNLTYDMWKKQLDLWKICCRLDKNQQASELILSLTGKAREAALELDIKEIHTDNGVENVIKKLDGLFLKDENQLIYVSLKKFEHYKRAKDQTIDDYINEFERLYNKLKHYKIEYPDTAVAYRLLESANLPKDRSELIRTTISKLEYNAVKVQLRKLEDSAIGTADSFEVPDIKSEPSDTFYTRETRGRSSRGRGGSSRGRGGRYGGRYGSRGRGRGACYVCKEYGHWANECPQKEDDRSNNEEEEALFSENYEVEEASEVKIYI